MYNMKNVVNLLGKKYPSSEDESIVPAIIIYDDESGRIVKNLVGENVYAGANLLFSFDSIKELVDHLTND